MIVPLSPLLRKAPKGNGIGATGSKNPRAYYNICFSLLCMVLRALVWFQEPFAPIPLPLGALLIYAAWQVFARFLCCARARVRTGALDARISSNLSIRVVRVVCLIEIIQTSLDRANRISVNSTRPLPLSLESGPPPAEWLSEVRPISILALSLLRLLDSKLPGNPLWPGNSAP